MSRFVQTKKKTAYTKLLASLCIFFVIIFIFFQSVTSLSDSTKARQRESLENALSRDITYCYTVEGTYPESLDYIKENYGLTYDEDRFYIDYKVMGSNIFPDVTIIEKED